MDQSTIMAFLTSLYAAPLYIDDVAPDQWDIVRYCERAALIRRTKDLHGNKCFVVTETCKFAYPSLGNDVIAIRRQYPHQETSIPMDQSTIMAFLASLYAAPLYIDDVAPDQWDIVRYCERAALIRRTKDLHGNKCFVVTETCKFTYPSLGNDVIAIRRRNPNK